LIKHLNFTYFSQHPATFTISTKIYAPLARSGAPAPLLSTAAASTETSNMATYKALPWLVTL